jgi:polyisoprenoid-binding protein YceI
MARAIGFIAVGLLLCAGCNSQTTTTSETSTPVPAAGDTSASQDVIPAEMTSSEGTVAVSDTRVELNPSNTRIGWVGTHTGDKPDPRVGSFEKFTGVAEVDPASKTLKSVSVEIDTASLKSPIDNLTKHLNSPDFFDTREFPTATFKSTKIADDGTVTGDLTLHGVTKEVSFPATINVTETGLAVKAEFTIDRTDFKIGENQDRVEKEVQINVTVGDQENGAAASSDGNASNP